MLSGTAGKSLAYWFARGALHNSVPNSRNGGKKRKTWTTLTAASSLFVLFAGACIHPQVSLLSFRGKYLPNLAQTNKLPEHGYQHKSQCQPSFCVALNTPSLSSSLWLSPFDKWKWPFDHESHVEAVEMFTSDFLSGMAVVQSWSYLWLEFAATVPVQLS